MSILDKLLETDIKKLQDREVRRYEVKRLSEAIGEPFVVNCKPLNSEQMQHIGEISETNADARIHVVLEGCDIDGKRFSHSDFLSKFNVQKGKDVVQRLFKVGEISALYSIVNKISGYSEDAVVEAVTEVKN